MKATYLFPVFLLIAGCGSSPSPPAATTSANTPQSGDVQLAIVSYDQILERVANGRGKVVVMDAWSTSCPPCMKEFHNLVELHHKFGGDKVQCMSLSFDFEGLGTPEEQAGRVLDFLRGQKATFENLMSNEESDSLYRKFKLAAVPAVFVYDRQGNLRIRFDNQKAKSKAEQFTYADVGALVEQLLADSPGEAQGAESAAATGDEGPKLP